MDLNYDTLMPEQFVPTPPTFNLDPDIPSIDSQRTLYLSGQANSGCDCILIGYTPARRLFTKIVCWRVSRVKINQTLRFFIFCTRWLCVKQTKFRTILLKRIQRHFFKRGRCIMYKKILRN
jgi:hypothetical protein